MRPWKRKTKVVVMQAYRNAPVLCTLPIGWVIPRHGEKIVVKTAVFTVRDILHDHAANIITVIVM